MTLKDIAIFKLKPLVANFSAKISAATENNTNSQILCLVHENNDLFFRYTNYEERSVPGQDVTVKLLPWFNEHGKVVRSICFDPSNERLLVLCDENTLHIVPVLAIVQEQQQQQFSAETKSSSLSSPSKTSSPPSSSSSQQQQITSFVIPFVGPHECPNPRTCPNNFYRPQEELEKSLKTISATGLKKPSPTLDDLYSTQSVDLLLSVRNESSTYFNAAESTSSGEVVEDAPKKEGIVCPYPTACIWWQTKRKQDRAIVGYSDGSVCFLSLTPNCPFIANTTLSDAVDSFDICRDASGQTVTLLINTSQNTQWKLLLEEEQTRYTFPGDSPTTVADNLGSLISPSSKSSHDSKIDQDWQFVVATNSPPQITISSPSTSSQQQGARRESEGMVQSMPKLFPTTRAGISYLREIGTKKIGALKQRLSTTKREESVENEPPPVERKDAYDDDDWADEPTAVNFEVLETPSVTPEMITSSQGPKIIVKNHNDRSALFALHERQATVSVHNLNMDPDPFYVYSLPENCQDVLMTQNTIYTIQKVTAAQRNGRVGADGSMEEHSAVNGEDKDQQLVACGVISKTLAIKNKDSDLFQDRALVTYFPFHAENVISIHGLYVRPPPSRGNTRLSNRREVSPTLAAPAAMQKLTVKDYVKQRAQYEGVDANNSIGPGAEIINDVRILETAFPRVEFESCFVVTDKNTYAVELNEAPEVIFMNFARQSMWSSCKYFCDIFNISMAQCIEFVGDELLRQHKVTQALVTYNVAQIPPIKTALKLATYGESNALLHLCAMALKCVYVLKSSRPQGGHAKALMEDLALRTIPKKSQAGVKRKPPSEGDLNSGFRCSDFSYDHDEVGMEVQMSFSSQFHLSNLMFLTLCEKTLTAEKNYFPLWNFVQVNQRFHTTLASTILSQGGMYSTAVLLAKVRGAGLDVFMSLVKALKQEIGTDINYLVYNLSEGMFRECVTYLSAVAIDYFAAIVQNLEKFSIHVVDRLVEQLNPFAACFRPIVSRLSALRHSHRRSRIDEDKLFPIYCNSYVEAFLGVLMRSVEMKEGAKSQLLNGLTNINIRYESMANLGVTKRLQQVSAGYAHACRVVNENAFVWGSNQIPYVVDDNFGAMAPGIESSSLGSRPKMVKFLSNLNISVLSVHCGRTHTLLYTNNGLYAMGANSLGQLGVGSHVSQSLHPVLVETLMDWNLELIAVGQYHNAVVANSKMYTWGWGVYGQLGNGGIEDQHVPTELPFFSGRKIKQISLGHVHSLVLCESASKDNFLEDLYVFGSNYFGQLGTGPTAEHSGEEKGMSKSLVPIRLDFNERIRFVHTKFFVNFVVTESNELFTWGASPQALRVINQARKRARSQIRSELAKEKEALEAQQQEEIPQEEKEKSVTEGTKENSPADGQTEVVELPSPSSSGAFTIKEPETPKEKREMRPKIEARKNRRHSLTNLNSKLKGKGRNSSGRIPRSPSEETLPKRGGAGSESTPPPPLSLKRRSENSPESDGGEKAKEGAEVPLELKPDFSDLEEWTEHLRPIKVDTSNLEEEEILEVSSGLYHFALRTENGVSKGNMKIYTWGKNLEKQLGNDSSRADVQIPTQLESIKRPLSVNCGADFTLVLVREGGSGGEVLLAFGNNNMGQCGRETGEKSALMGKWVRLKISKRHIRIPDGSACVSAPTEVPFDEDKEDEREKKDKDRGKKLNPVPPPIKSLPQFKRKFFAMSRYLSKYEVKNGNEEKMDKGVERQEVEEEEMNERKINGKVENLELNLSSLHLSRSTECNSDDLITPDEDDAEDIYSTLDKEELDKNTEKEAMNLRSKLIRKTKDESTDILKNGLPVNSSSSVVSAEFIHYCLYLFYGIYDTEAVAGKCAFAEFRIRMKMLQGKFFEAFQLALKEVIAAPAANGDDVKMHQAIVLLEFFTKDENLIPMHEEDLKYFIQEIFLLFIDQNWDLEVLEEYFKSDLSFYVIPLAYVLFFDIGAAPTEIDLNGDGTERLLMNSSAELDGEDEGAIGGVEGGSGAKQLRDSVLLKYRTFFNHLECAPKKYHVAGATRIFGKVSVVFNAMICQRVVEMFEQVGREQQ